LVLLDVLLKLRKRERILLRGTGDGGAGIFGHELVADLAENLLCDEGRVLFVRDDNTSDAFDAAVEMDEVAWTEPDC
jgi:hypothetical protein